MLAPLVANRFPNSGIRAKGWLATAWPPARGRPVIAKAPYKGATGCGQGPLQGGNWILPRPARRGSSRPWAQPLAARRPQGRPAVGRPQRAIANGQPTRGGCNGQGCRRARALVACAGAVAAAQRGQEGLGQSICEKDDRTPLNLGNFEDCPCV
ncbi:hypothetical protein BHM03_00029206 [Ensete ventricosum]|nr:hypothetical protein BHM03_00029206 [Ensete ventricosum]